ncbi:hypothetical protein Vi05172_g4109 [Venturia inaequalis]|uniref:Uncharacterized protein n=1 Tax=Venturia inaequalis TaxID=5025 RepID=A0A8H3ZFG3_VENIN|nr:hypothetical protein EG327_001702 [Venturia inaequalis]RDI85913.1 hypothetical protein Vi05172_g4109 [Venturia inaequalis]
MASHKRALSTGESSGPKRKQTESEPATPAKPQWGYVTSSKNAHPHDPAFEMLEIYLTLKEANDTIRGLSDADMDATVSWNEHVGSHGELELSRVDDEGQGIIYEVTRIPLRPVGYAAISSERESDEEEEGEEEEEDQVDD